MTGMCLGTRGKTVRDRNDLFLHGMFHLMEEKYAQVDKMS